MTLFSKAIFNNPLYGIKAMNKMTNETSTKVNVLSISLLKGKTFYVPGYQRGYKWRKSDVKNLICDIEEINDTEGDYCLQPIVVAPDNNKFILVDGQQRLTTIWLITNWAKHNNVEANFIDYDIKYEEGRCDSNKYLQALKENGKGEDVGTCDTHYFEEAIAAIKEESTKLTRFFTNLNSKVKIIWYPVDAKDGPAKFERLNSSRIGLTNAELVKALILTNSDSDYRQRLACEWDVIEYALQDNSFFAFITDRDSSYRNDYNRIELILDVYAKTTREDREKDEYATFNILAKKIQVGIKAKDLWQEIGNVYRRIESWYFGDDNFLYNMIGYLAQIKSRNSGSQSLLQDLYDYSSNHSIDEFKEYVKKKVIDTRPANIANLVYASNETRRALLLFNILSMMSCREEQGKKIYFFNDRFHFDLFQEQKWDIEHLHACASEPLTAVHEWVRWMKDIYPDFKKRYDESPIEARSKLNELSVVEWLEKAMKVKEAEVESIKQSSISLDKTALVGLKKELFTKIYQVVLEFLEGPADPSDSLQNSIGNLALLDQSTNRSYKAKPFSTKRRIILDRIKHGIFVPIATQNVFQKFYTDEPSQFYKWEKETINGKKSDKDYHIDAMVEILNRLN